MSHARGLCTCFRPAYLERISRLRWRLLKVAPGTLVQTRSMGSKVASKSTTQRLEGRSASKGTPQ